MRACGFHRPDVASRPLRSGPLGSRSLSGAPPEAPHLGSFTQNSDGAFDVLLGGITLGSFSQLNVSGAVTLVLLVGTPALQLPALSI